MKTRIKAIFKGLDGSLGYMKNFDYDLYIGIVDNGEIQIEALYHTETKICNYSNIITFLENWDLIRNND